MTKNRHEYTGFFFLATEPTRDADGFVNKRWGEFTGLSQEDAAESGWMAAVHPEDLQLYRERWHAYITNGDPFEFEVRFRCAANGEYRWLLARGVPLRRARKDPQVAWDSHRH